MKKDIADTKKSLYYPNLDGLRTIACLFVLVSHLVWETLLNASLLTDEPTGIRAVDTWLVFFGKNGGFGVRLFFVLSGFLITTLIVKEVYDFGKLNILKFYLRRILRIWPVYYLVIVFCFIAYPFLRNLFTGQSTRLSEDFLMSVSYLTNFDLIRILQQPLGNTNGMLSVTWSVSIEEQFYIFWPIIFFVFPKKYYKAIVVLLLIFSAAFTYAYKDDGLISYYHTFSNVIYLSTGGLLALLINDPAQKFAITLRNFPKPFTMLVGLLLALLIWAPPYLKTPALGNTVYVLLTCILLFTLLAHQVLLPHSKFQAGKSKFLIDNAKYTYGLYMYHRIVLWVVENICVKIFGQSSAILKSVVIITSTITLSFVVSKLSYDFYESYFLRLKEKFSHYKKTEAVKVDPLLINKAAKSNEFSEV